MKTCFPQLSSDFSVRGGHFQQNRVIQLSVTQSSFVNPASSFIKSFENENVFLNALKNSSASVLIRTSRRITCVLKAKLLPAIRRWRLEFLASFGSFTQCETLSAGSYSLLDERSLLFSSFKFFV